MYSSFGFQRVLVCCLLMQLAALSSVCKAQETSEVIQKAIAARKAEYDGLLTAGFLSRIFVTSKAVHEKPAGPEDWLVGIGIPQNETGGFLRFLQAEVARKADPDRFRFRGSHESVDNPQHFTEIGFNYWVDRENAYTLCPGDGEYYVFRSIRQREEEFRRVLPSVDYFSDAIGLGAVVGDDSFSVGAGLVYPFRVDVALQTGAYAVAQQNVEIEGAQCVRLSRPGVDELWLDKDRGYCVVRREWYWGEGKPIRARITNRGFSQKQGGVWVPASFEIEFFGSPDMMPGELCVVMSASVKEFQYGLEDNVFYPEEVPSGSRIRDYVSEQVFVMPSDSSVTLNDFVAQDNSIGEAFKTLDEEPHSYFRWVIIFNMVLLAVVAAVFAGRWLFNTNGRTTKA